MRRLILLLLLAFDAIARQRVVLLDANPLGGLDALIRPVEVFVRGVPVMPVRRRSARYR
jgi:hypothetical protein